MRPGPGRPALWVLDVCRRPSNTVDVIEAERRALYRRMDPGERLARALALSSFVLRMRESAPLSASP